MELRHYQQASIDGLRNGFIAGHTRQILALATGAGKSFTSAELIRLSIAKGSKVGIFCERRKLVDQFSDTLDRLNIDHGVIMSKHWRFRPQAQVQVISIQTFAKMPRQQHFDLIVIDEVHAAMHGHIQAYIDARPNVKVVGLSATPFAPILPKYFSHIINPITMRELVDEGSLLPYKVFIAHEVDTTDVKVSSDGEWDKKQLGERASVVVGDVVADYLSIGQRLHGRKTKAICFSAGIAHGAELVNRFLEVGVIAVQLTHENKDEEKQEIFKEFDKHDSAIDVLISAEMLQRGFDNTSVEHVILAKPLRKSFSSFVQMCLDSDTEILSKSGWKTIGGISETDFVATFNAENGEISYEKPLDIVKRKLTHGERMYRIKSPHLDIRVTGGHDMVWNTRDSVGKYSWRKDKAEVLYERSSDYVIPVSGSFKFKGCNLTDDEIRFLGLFLSDGSLNKSNNQIVISQSASQPQWIHDYIVNSINGSGFKHKEYIIKRTGKWSEYADNIVRNISKKFSIVDGKKYDGWYRLEDYISKEIPDIYNNLDERQFGILLEAINVGDGHKFKNVPWSPKTMSIAAGNNKVYADRIQEMCILRGYRCNISTEYYNKNPMYILRISKKYYSCVGGSKGEAGRSRIEIDSSNTDEMVWCVTTSMGNIITRRNGKANITGNCGRGARPHDGQTYCIIQDNGGNWMRFNDDWNKLYGDGVTELVGNGDAKTRKEKTAKEKEAAKCPVCYALWTGGLICPVCGHVKKQQAMVEEVAGEMVEFNGSVEKKEKFSSEFKEAFYQGLIAYARKKGFKDGWAWHAYQTKFNIQPTWKKVEGEITIDVMNHIKHQAIARSKGAKK